MLDSKQTRRDILRATAVISAMPFSGKVLGANNRIKVGWIGVGNRGFYCLRLLHEGNADRVEVTAVCDTYQGHLARGKDLVQTRWGITPKTYVDYRDLIQDPNVEAVFIMTPEHLHYEMTMAALKAGKHVYVEKPLAHTIEECVEIVQEAERSGRVVQVGTQNRSNKLYQKAKELVEEGMIGECHYVRAFWYRNSLPDNPAWRYRIPEDASPETADWVKFLGPAPRRPFDARRYFQWRLYWDYSHGIATDLLVHQTDITHFVLNKHAPLSVVASGGIYRWTDPTDDREVPDTFSAIYEYPDRFHINYSCYFGNQHYGYGENFMGNEGTIEVLNRRELHFYPEQFRPQTPPRIASRKELHLDAVKDFNQPDATLDHIRNFIDAILGKAKVVAPPQSGLEAAVTGILASIAYRNKKMVYWDPNSYRYRFA